jgi:hypothetical protein
MRRIGLSAMAAASLVLCLAAAPAGASRLEPVDEGPRRPDFLAFRRQLQQSVARRDVPGLLRVVHRAIKNGFGGDDGIEAFERRWGLGKPDSELWRELGAVLALGGTFEEPDTFVAPYVFSRWPQEFDAFDHVALVGSNVRVRSAPKADAPILETHSFAILRLGRQGGYRAGPWTAVDLSDGRSGFVASELTRSAVDYRAFFTVVDGRWQMTMLLAGD